MGQWWGFTMHPSRTDPRCLLPRSASPADYIVPAYDRNFSIIAAEGLVERRVVSGNEIGVTFEWLTASGVYNGPGSMQATMLQGNPYLTLRVNALTLRMPQTSANPIVVGTGTSTGTSFKVRQEARALRLHCSFALGSGRYGST